MGTNYYIRNNECKSCDRYEEVHLGKSSFGRDFTFQYNGGKLYKNYDDFKEFLKDKVIYDEYGEKQELKEFINFIENKKKDYGKKHLEDNKSFYVGDYYFLDCEFS